MKFDDFKKEFKSRMYILSRDVRTDQEDHQAMLNQLSRWQKRGLILPLRKGVYVLGPTQSSSSPDLLMLANIIYEPSYVSLEYALHFYGLIPERVMQVTSITTRKTKSFKNSFGCFVYQHLKPCAFRGFRQELGKGGSFFLAEPEKAVVDFLYLNLARFTHDPCRVMQESYRFQNMEDLQPARLLELGHLFECKKLMKVIGTLTEFLHQECL